MRACVLFMIVFSGSFFEGNSPCSREFRVNAAKIQDQNEAVAIVNIHAIEENIMINKKKRSVKKVDSNHNKGNSDKGLHGYFNSTIAKSPPKFKNPSKMYPMDMKPAGSTVRLKCLSVGNPIPNVTWFKNHDLIRRPYFPPAYGKWSVELEDLTKDDSGEYTCLVCNELGCISHSVSLRVQERYPSIPYIKEGYPGNVTVKVNEMVQLSCPLISDMEPFVFWVKAYDNFSSNSLEVGTDEIPNGDSIESEEPTDKPEMFTIRNVTHKDQGWYICIAQNTLGRRVAKGYLTDLEHLEEQKAEQHDQFVISKWTVLFIPFFMVLFISNTIIVLVIIIKRLRKEKRKNSQAVETVRLVRVMMEGHCAKVVRVECNNTNINECELIAPSISIEKIKYCELPQDIDKTRLSSEYILPVDTKWEVTKERLSLGKILGDGEFGIVYRAECIRTPNTNLPGTVAVKTLKEGHSDTDMLALVSEMEIMKMIGKHENIINLLGCCTQDGPLYVVVEYARHGCLRDYLKRHKPHKTNASTENLLNKPPTQKELRDFAWQVAKGMKYLASRGCIHRDLAARNVLVSADMVLKIADFGLARDVRDSDYYRKRTAGKLPVRWMAPESLCHNYYTTQSDVWSFGVLTWEIMTYGDTPHANIPPHFLYNYLRQGKRMERPDNCSEDMYQLMKSCCIFNPDNRPSFSDVREKLELIYSKINKL